MYRVKYEQTVMDIKAAVAKRTGVPADKQQLFWHQNELTSAYDAKTLLEMHLHTGFSLRGYDMVCCRHLTLCLKQLFVDKQNCLQSSCLTTACSICMRTKFHVESFNVSRMPYGSMQK